MIRRITFLAIWIALMLVGGLVQGQGVTFCGKLSADDCDTLNATNVTMSKVKATLFHLDMHFTLGGIPGLDTEDFMIRVVGDGAYSIDPVKEAVAAKLTAEAQTDPKKLGQAFEAVLRSFSADITGFLELSDALTDIISNRRADFPSRIPFGLRLVEGIGYINLDKIAELDKSGNVKPGWYGVDIASFYRALLEQNPQALTPGNNLGTLDPSLMSKFMEVARLSDTEINGQAMAVFETTLDFPKLMAQPAARELVKGALRNGLGQQGLSGQRLETFLEDYLKVLENMTFDWSQTVGLADKYLHRFEANWLWKPDMQALGRLLGSGTSGLGSAEIEYQFTVTIDLSHFNDVPAIVVPKNATVVPLGQLIPGLSPGLSQTSR